MYGGNDSEAYRAFLYEASSTSTATTKQQHISTTTAAITNSNGKNAMAKAARVALADYTMRILSKLLLISPMTSI